MMKNYKLLLLALLSVAAPVCAMSQEGEEARAQEKARIRAIAQEMVAKYGPEQAKILAQGFKYAAQRYEREQNGEVLAPEPDNTMIHCEKCNKAHKRPIKYIFSRNQNLIECHPCFEILVQEGKIEPIVNFC